MSGSDRTPEGEAASIAALEKSRGATQFGGERGNTPNNCPGGANTRSYSIRHSLRYLARAEVDLNDKDAFKVILPTKPTVAQLIAANTLAKASKADMRAVEYVTDQIDGKLAQVNVNAELAELMNKTPEELDEIDRELNRRIEHTTRPGPAQDGEAPGVGTSAGADQGAAGAGSDKPLG